MNQVMKSVCGLCSGSCGVLITLHNGKAMEVRGDPESTPNKGALCAIGSASLQYLYHPDRLKHPLRRMGERGSGQWQRISWAEALDRITDELNKVKRNYGAESVAMVHGSAKGYQDTHLVRLANAFGTPNVTCADYVCYVPRMLAAETTFGFMPGCDYEYPPACIVVWGANKAETRFYVHRNILCAKNRGAKVICIDPLKSKSSENADMWIQVRPGTDLLLALAMINVIIDQNLYDRDFVEKWTTGFEQLKTHVQAYSPEKVAEMTWVDVNTIIEAARLYATNKPACIEWGNALDQTTNAFQTSRAIAILMAITGNLGIPGGQTERAGAGFREGDLDSSDIGILGRWSSEIELRRVLPKATQLNKVGAGLTLLPDFRYVPPYSIIKAITDEDPYPIHAMFVQGSNPLSSWSNIQEVYTAFLQLGFLAVSDLFMTPTAALADVVLPVASYLEYDGIVMPPSGTLAKVQRKIAQIGECRSDHEIINGLAQNLGLAEHFWDKLDDFWDAILKPVDLTFEKFKRVGLNPGIKQNYQYKINGFNTPSGKVELYSNQLEQLGLDPLPGYNKPHEQTYCDPHSNNVFNLILTGRKVGPYRHSGGRQIPSLRRLQPDPTAIVHQKTASKLGIEDGDWIYIETVRGRIKQRASLSMSVDERVVVSDIGWWFPEKGISDLYGWAESNYNVLTDNKPPFSPDVGSVNLRGLSCRIYKSQQ